MTDAKQSQTIVASHNRVVLGIVIFLIIGLAIGAFVLSFDALHALAIASAIEPGLAWLWPLIIDGFIVTATIAIFSLRGRGGTWYPWAALILFAFVSVFGNSIHAVNNQATLGVNVWIASAVSAAPAIALLLSSHFLVIMISAPRRITVEATEIVTSSEPDKVIAQTVVTEPFEEPKLRFKPSEPPRIITPENKPHSAPSPVTVEPEERVESYSPVVITQPTQTPVERTVTAERATQPVTERVVETPQPSPVQEVLVAEPKPIEPKTVNTNSGKKSVTDEELIAWLRANDKNISPSKLSAVFGVSQRTIQRRLSKLKEQYGENLETM
jgi:hypothetical protein